MVKTSLQTRRVSQIRRRVTEVARIFAGKVNNQPRRVTLYSVFPSPLSPLVRNPKFLGNSTLQAISASSSNPPSFLEPRVLLT